MQFYVNLSCLNTILDEQQPFTWDWTAEGTNKEYEYYTQGKSMNTTLKVPRLNKKKILKKWTDKDYFIFVVLL